MQKITLGEVPLARPRPSPPKTTSGAFTDASATLCWHSEVFVRLSDEAQYDLFRDDPLEE